MQPPDRATWAAMAIPVPDVRRLFSSFKSKVGRLMRVDIASASCSPFLPPGTSVTGLEAQSSCWPGNILWCQHFLHESPPGQAPDTVRNGLWSTWLLYSGIFLNSDHKEGCVPKQVWHHEWGFSLLQSEPAPVIGQIRCLQNPQVSKDNYRIFFFFCLFYVPIRCLILLDRVYTY